MANVVFRTRLRGWEEYSNLLGPQRIELSDVLTHDYDAVHSTEIGIEDKMERTAIVVGALISKLVDKNLLELEDVKEIFGEIVRWKNYEVQLCDGKGNEIEVTNGP